MLFLYLALLENPEDEQSFNEFYEKFRKTVYYIAYEHLKNEQDAEDCEQEVFMALAKNFHNISHRFDDKSVWSFVRIVTKNIAISKYRKNKRESDYVVDADITEFYSIAEENFDVFDEIQLNDAINNLPEEYQGIFYLKYVCNYSGEEISNLLNISHSLVRKRCMLGMKLARKYLEGDE